jgi:energy-coupling factor transporter ATP-binding protein EcfA2
MPTWTESLRALFSGCVLPATLDELRGPLLVAIEDLAGEVLDSYSPQSDIQLLFADASQTLAIMGERGSGKSTLLAAVAGEIRRAGQHIVLPIMRPELFGEADSVITTFLAELWDMLSLESSAPMMAGEGRTGDATALKLLADAARGYAVSRTTTAALEYGTDGPHDFAEDSLTVSRSGVRLARQLRALASELCARPAKDGGPRLIIVPIDDPDLAHQSIVKILADLQILGSVPGIVPLTCFSPSDLNEAWLAARRDTLPNVTTEHLHFLLARQLEKVFPYRCRFEIEPVAPSHRIEFAPISRDIPLRAKLSTLRSRVEGITGTTWAFDEALTNAASKFGLPNPLPDNPRTLVQLWETLDVLESEPDTPTFELLYLTLRRTLKIIAEPVIARLGSPMPEIAQIGPPSPDDPTKRPIKSDLARVDFFVSAVGRSEGQSDRPAIASLSLNRLHELRATLPSERSKPRSTLKPEEYLSGGVIAAMLALQEISFGTGLFDVDGSRIYLGGDDWRFLQTIELANQPTDDMFLMLPNATTLSEILRVVTLWNELATLSADLETEDLLATFIRAACLTIARDDSLEPAGNYEDAFDLACSTYKVSQKRGGNTAEAFAHWFEALLPLQWHSALVSGDTIRKLAYTHKELCAKSQAPRAAAHQSDNGLFDRRIGVLIEALGEADTDNEARYTWVAGYFDLASCIRSEHLDRLSQLYPRWQRDVARVRAGAASVGAITQVKARSRMAPFPTPEGTQLLAVGTAALQKARKAAYTRLRSS